MKPQDKKEIMSLLEKMMQMPESMGESEEMEDEESEEGCEMKGKGLGMKDKLKALGELEGVEVQEIKIMKPKKKKEEEMLAELASK